MLTGLHITHNDADGVGCAIVSNYLIPEAKWTNIFVDDISHYKQEDIVYDYIKDWKLNKSPIPDIMFISDLSVREDCWFDLCNICAEHQTILVGFDHHPSNPLLEYNKTKYHGYMWINEPGEIVPDFAVLPYMELAQKVSATYLIAHTLTGMSRLPYPYYQTNNRIVDFIQLRALSLVSDKFMSLVRDISRYDAWGWVTVPDDETRKKYLYHDDGFDHQEDVWQTLNAFYTPEKFFDKMLNGYLVSKIENYDQYHNTIIEFNAIYKILNDKNVENCKVENFSDKIAIFNYEYNNTTVRCGLGIVNGKANLISQAAINYRDSYNNKYVDFCIIMYPQYCSISMYSVGKTVDVGTLCTKMGGGGHYNAAGTSVSCNMMLKLYKLWYDSKASHRMNDIILRAKSGDMHAFTVPNLISLTNQTYWNGVLEWDDLV